MSNLKIDKELLLKFEEGLNPRYPEKSKIPAGIIGFGEISTVFEIGEKSRRDLAYKRMPIFKNMEEVNQYEQIYNEYNKLLNVRLGMNIPPYDSVLVETGDNRSVLFVVQKKLHPGSIGSSLIHILPEDEVLLMVKLVLREMKRVWDFNKKNKKLEIGIDGQISNWATINFKPGKPGINKDTKFYYIDTTTPFIRKDGTEQLNTELFLRSAPSFLVWLLRWLFLEDVVNRYYDFHLVAVDLIANFYKEQLPGFIPKLIDITNDFFKNEAKDLNQEPVTEKEVKSYYKEDAMIWSLYLFFRKIDRFLRTRITRKGYPYILPGKIKR